MIFVRFVLVCLLLVSCQKKPETTTFSGVAMTVPYRILVGSILNSEQLTLAQKTIQNTFSEVNSTYNQWNPDSEVSRFNRQPVNEPFALSPELAQFVRRCGELVELTEGYFDPTIEPLWKLWLENMREGQAPDELEMAQVAVKVGWKHLKLDGNDLTKDVEGVSLNFDSVAKGYCVDLITERLTKAGFSDVLVDWGGEMRATGQHPQARAWRVAIRSLDGQEQPVANLELVDSAVATSGDYLQYWTIGNGATYTHVINPVTMRAVQIQLGTVASVSVLAPDCMLADALATAVMAWGSVEAAEPWIKRIQTQLPSIQFWFVPR